MLRAMKGISDSTLIIHLVLLPGVASMPLRSRESLTKAGYALGSRGGQPAPALVRRCNETGALRGLHLIELCCSKDSWICEEAHLRGWSISRYTKERDLTSPDVIDALIKEIETCPKEVLLWASLPCTGGSSLTHVNWNRGEATQLKIAEHWRVASLLWDTFVRAADSVREVNGIICLEWPMACWYWSLEPVDSYCQRQLPWMARVDACSLQSPMGMVRQKGTPSPVPLKPFRIQCSHRTFASRISSRCPGHSSHPHLTGERLRRGEEYNRAFAVRMVSAAEQVWEAVSIDDGRESWPQADMAAACPAVMPRNGEEEVSDVGTDGRTPVRGGACPRSPPRCARSAEVP